MSFSSPEIQLKRLLFRRPDFTEEQALQIIAAQIPLSQKEEMAHWVIASNTEKPFDAADGFEQIASLYRTVLHPSKSSTILWLGIFYIGFFFCGKCIYILGKHITDLLSSHLSQVRGRMVNLGA